MSKALLKPDEVRVPERIQRAITRYLAGSLSLEASAEAEGVSTGAVCYWRRRAGMPQAVRGSPHQFARGLVLAFLAQVAAAGLPAHAAAA